MIKLAWALLLALPVVPLRGPCDLKTVEKKAWCATCLAYIPRAEVKASTCPKDKGKVEIVDVCVKNMYVARCHPTTSGLKPIACCGVTYDKPTELTARVFWACETCKEKGANREAVKHPESCAEKKVVKTCEKSGTAPHSSIGK